MAVAKGDAVKYIKGKQDGALPFDMVGVVESIDQGFANVRTSNGTARIPIKSLEKAKVLNG